jgi:hypothetical protein
MQLLWSSVVSVDIRATRSKSIRGPRTSQQVLSGRLLCFTFTILSFAFRTFHLTTQLTQLTMSLKRKRDDFREAMGS